MSCQIDIDVGDYCEMLEIKTPVARKDHKCIECGRKIKKGEKYLYEKTVFEGVIDNIKTCCDCESLRTFLCSWHYGGIRDDIRENIFGLELTPAALDKLTGPAKDFILGLVEEEDNY